jgi:hypothetical protein
MCSSFIVGRHVSQARGEIQIVEKERFTGVVQTNANHGSIQLSFSSIVCILAPNAGKGPKTPDPILPRQSRAQIHRIIDHV